MIKAVIDLGTNTFNLLIARVEQNTFDVLHAEKEAVALGMGGILQRLITPEATSRALTALKKFKTVCDAYQVQYIHAFGTSALRDASNQVAFCELVWEHTGIAVHVISGRQEAEYIYKGIGLSYHFDAPSMVMDIGGGSTEFIFARAGELVDAHSFDIGVSRLFQQFPFSDPLTTEEIKQLETHLEVATAPFFEDKACEVLVGASGSFETFWELLHQARFSEKLKCLEVDKTALECVLDELICSTAASREANPWIIPIRKHLAPITAVKTRWILQKLNPQRILISPCSLKEGAMMHEL